MPSSIIIWNILAASDVTVVSEQTTAAFRRCLDGRLTTNAGVASGATRVVVVDLGSARTFNTIGLARHNFGSVSCSLAIYTGSSTTASTATLLATIAPTEDFVQWFDIGNTVTERYLYFYFSGHSSAAYFGDIMMGHVLSFGVGQPIGFVDPVLANDDEIIGNITRGGLIAGTSYRPLPKKFTISFDAVPSTTFDTWWPAVVDTLRKGPFYFRWADTADGYATPKRATYCWISKNISSPKYISSRHCSVTLQVEGVTE